MCLKHLSHFVHNLNSDYMKKLYSSAGNICTMFYLYNNKPVRFINACILLFGYTSKYVRKGT